jgi:small subunit ribosomal protein S20
LQKVKYYVKILDVIVYYRLRGGAKSDMPNIKSAKKRVKVIEKKTLRNNMIKSGYKSAVRKFEEAIEAGNIEEAKTLFSQATKKIDQACTKGVIVKNTAARKKSNLSKKLNAAIA